MNSIPLVIFAKEPKPGEVKTRLQTHCSAEQCAGIAAILLEQSIRNAVEHWPGSVVLAAWPPARHHYCSELAVRYQIELIGQADGDLGLKMHLALEQLGYPAAIVGSDVPHVPPEVFATAHAALSANENCLGPSEDGGYYLIGLGRSAPWLFEGVAWGTSSVLQATRARAADHDCSLRALPTLNDIDVWDDVLLLAKTDEQLLSYLVQNGLSA